MMTMDPPVEVKPASPTERKIAEMLLENTGSHFLDSGGAYGRAWQHERARLGLDGGLPNNTFDGSNRPAHDPEPDEIEMAVRAFRADPEAIVDRYGSLDLSTFHFLVDRLEYVPELDRRFTLFCMIRDAGKDRWDRESWYEQKELWLDALKRRGMATLSAGDNSYNYDCALSRTIQYDIFSIDNDEQRRQILPDGMYVMLQIHGGADVRGGYTKPVLFSIDGYEGEYDLLNYSGTGAGASCPGSDPNPDIPDGQTTLDGEPVSHEGQYHSWYIEGGYHIRFEDPDTNRPLVFYDQMDLDDIEAIESGHPNTYASYREDEVPKVRDPRPQGEADIAVIDLIEDEDGKVIGHRWLCQQHGQPLSFWGPYVSG